MTENKPDKDFQEKITEVFDILHQKYKKEKHEKIEKMAWNIYLHFNAHPSTEFSMSKSWELAEEFYNFAEKQEEDDGN